MLFKKGKFMKICEYNTRLNEERMPILMERQKYKIDGRRSFRTPQAVAELSALTIGLKDAAEEHIYALAFNSNMQLIALFEISHGTVNASLASTREIMQKLLLVGAVSFAIVHNHPSGNTTPSEEDRAMTKAVADAGKLMHIPLMDHVIVGGDECGNYSYSSFREIRELEGP